MIRRRGGEKRVKTVLLVFLIACALAGCQEKRDNKVHVIYWEKWTGLEAAAMQAVVDAFNNSQDRIEVDYLTTSEADQKTLVATAGGDPPDVAGLYTYNVYSFADASALTPLDDFIAKDGGTVESFLSRYYPIFGNVGAYRGKLWALPSTPITVALHWNKGMFREAGLDPEHPPETVEELDRIADQLTRRDPRTGAILQLGFLPQEPFWFSWAYPEWFGSKLWDGKNITLDTPLAEDAYDWVLGYSKRYGLNAIRSFAGGFGQFSSPQNAFFSGKVAMVFQGVFLNNFIRQYAPGLDYGVAVWPKTPHGPNDFAVADSDVLVIPRGSRHAEEAWEFIQYVSSNNPKAESESELKGMELLCYLQQKGSPLLTWSPFFEHHHPHPYIDLFRRLGASPHATIWPKMGIWVEYRRELINLLDTVRLLRKPPKEALEDAQKRMAESWSWHVKELSRRGPTYSGETQTDRR